MAGGFLTGYWVHESHPNIVARVDGTSFEGDAEIIRFSVANTYNEAAGWNEGGGLPIDTFLEIYAEGPHEVIPMVPKELERGGLCGKPYREGFDPITCNKDVNHDGRCAFQWGVKRG